MESSLFRYDLWKNDFEYRSVPVNKLLDYIDEGWEVLVPTRRFNDLVCVVMEKSAYHKYLTRPVLANLLYEDLIKLVRKEERHARQ